MRSFKLRTFLLVKYCLERLINFVKQLKKIKKFPSKGGIILLLSISSKFCVLQLLPETSICQTLLNTRDRMS